MRRLNQRSISIGGNDQCDKLPIWKPLKVIEQYGPYGMTNHEQLTKEKPYWVEEGFIVVTQG